MTHAEATQLRQDYLHLKGHSYPDPKKKQTDTILDIVVTPQDHPFYPEFLNFYRQTGSYSAASDLVFEKHQEEIIYTVKCVLDELYDMENELGLHVLVDLEDVLVYTGN